MSEDSKPSSDKKLSIEIRIEWPIHTGKDLVYAEASAVTTVKNGYVLELGRYVLSGVVGRSEEQIREAVSAAEVNVVGRFILPTEALIGLRDSINTRLDADSRGRDDASN